ncbi:hypothetical protein DYH10_03455 [Candidatus Saccharibacteria bacterium CPR2]|nr:hypothetical protein [Candidatus Saccharibacteria bacterium CPR2]
MRRVFGIAGLSLLVVLGTLVNILSMPNQARADVIADRVMSLTSTAAGVSGVVYTFSFDVPSTTIIKSFKAEICTTASGTCTPPSDFSALSADLNSQPSGFGDASGWTDESLTGAMRMKNSTNSSSPGATQSVAFNTVTNPSDMATSFFARIYTYSDDSYTTLIDGGTIVSPTGEDSVLTVNVDEVMSFCIYTGANCAAGGYSVSLGAISISTTGFGTSKMDVATNAGSGFNITVSGNTLSSASDSIIALASQTASSVGSSQFGINLVDNVNPDVGSFRTGDTNANPTNSYDDIDLYKFVSGETIASSTQPTNTSTFTVAYIANIASDTEAGSYSTTLTYNCSATF